MLTDLFHLKDKISFDGPLASDLRCLELLAYHPAHAHAFCHHDFYYELIGSMGRQYREGKVTEKDIEVFDRGSRLIAYVISVGLLVLY